MNLDQMAEQMERKLGQWAAWVICQHGRESRLDGLVLRCLGDRMWIEDRETGDILGLTTKLSLGTWRPPDLSSTSQDS